MTRRAPGPLADTILATYAGLATLGGPLLRRLHRQRIARGREDPARASERFGIAGRPRPKGRLVWFHAASVGEALSILSLLHALAVRQPRLRLLVTTGTVTSAQILAERLPAAVIHQYVPYDRPAWVAAFLDHWRPDLAAFVESELWPTTLRALERRGVPTLLLNARLSDRSYASWRRLAPLARRLLSIPTLVLAQSPAMAERLRSFGARVEAVGNLKWASEPLQVDPAALAAAKATIGSRPVWALASSHPGEEELALEAHQALAARWPELLTILVPRHPARGDEVAALAAELGLAVSRRSQNGPPSAPIYLVDTIGELGLVYRLAPIVVVGGSFVAHGGQNPIEPAQLGAAVLYGPHMENFADSTALLEAAGAAEPIATRAALVPALTRLLADPALADTRGQAAQEAALGHRAALDRTLAAIKAELERL